MIERILPASPGSRPLDRHGALRIRSGRLVGQSGDPVILRGMSLFWSQWGGEHYDAGCIARLASDWRVDVVRACLGVGPDGYLDHPIREMAKIEKVIDAAIAERIYVIVNWHSHTASTERALEAFGHVASRYPGCPNLLFEPWNEPIGQDWRSEIATHHRAVVSMLRERGMENVAICGTGDYCRDLDAVAAAPLDLDGICYAVHFYAASHRLGLRTRIDTALARGMCVFASEYGLSEASGDGVLDIPEMNRWWEFLEERGISHVNWALHDKAEASAALHPPSLRTRLFGTRRLTKSGRTVRAHIRAGAKRAAPPSATGAMQ